MEVWESILYGLVGGISELLPISFSGHVAVVREIFGMSALNEAGGYYIRLMICLGVILAIRLAFSEEVRELGNAVGTITGLKRVRRRDRPNAARCRSVMLGLFALIPMLLSLIFTARAERISRLPYIALFFLLNGTLIFFACRRAAGKKQEKQVLLSDMLMIGFARMLSVFPGLSSVGSSVFVGNLRGLSASYNLRLTYLLSMTFEICALVYHLLRAVIYGSFHAGLWLPMLLTLIFSTVTGYLAIQYVRYLLNHGKFHFFAYYCWDAAAVVLVLSLINL